MGPALEAFEEHRVRLVSQAASDLNFTAVVDRDGADELVRRLHERLIPTEPDADVFGPSWKELSPVPRPREAPTEADPAASS